MSQVVLKPQEGPQTMFLASPADIVIYGGAAGGGKAQPLDEPVLTRGGFVPMGSIRVGSKVMTPHGYEANVVQIHPQGIKPIYSFLLESEAETRCTSFVRMRRP